MSNKHNVLPFTDRSQRPPKVRTKEYRQRIDDGKAFIPTPARVETVAAILQHNDRLPAICRVIDYDTATATERKAYRDALGVGLGELVELIFDVEDM